MFIIVNDTFESLQMFFEICFTHISVLFRKVFLEILTEIYTVVDFCDENLVNVDKKGVGHVRYYHCGRWSWWCQWLLFMCVVFTNNFRCCYGMKSNDSGLELVRKDSYIRSKGCARVPDANGKVVIPKEWTSIDNAAFYQCYSLKSVEFEYPASLQSIGHSAFLELIALTSISIVTTVQYSVV